MVASDVLAETGIDHSSVAAKLADVDPESVPVRALPFWVDLVLPAWIGAVTLPSSIWIRRRMLAIGGRSLGKLVLHELVHVQQWREHGVIGFLRHYLKDYLSARLRERGGHRAAYRAIPFEDEAYTLAATFDDTSAT